MERTKNKTAKLPAKDWGDKSFGKRVKLARMYAGVTQPELAELLDCGTELMSRIENNRVSPRVEMVTRMAYTLGVDAVWLLTGIGSAR